MTPGASCWVWIRRPGRLPQHQPPLEGQVPVIVLEHLAAVRRRALVLADNRLALSAGWDEELLQLELTALREADFDLDVLGFEDEELAALLGGNEDRSRTY